MAAIDLLSEPLLPIDEAPKHVPGNPHKSTIRRWHSPGVRGVRLETVVIGVKRFTTIPALHRFIERTTKAADSALVSSTAEQVASRREPRPSAVAAAEALERRGY